MFAQPNHKSASSIESVLKTLWIPADRQCLEDCRKAARVLCDFPSLLGYCLLTRHTWDAVHDAYIFSGDASTQQAVDFAVEFQEILNSAMSKVVGVAEDCSDSRALRYSHSIRHRARLTGALLNDGLDSVYQAFLSGLNNDALLQRLPLELFPYCLNVVSCPASSTLALPRYLCAALVSFLTHKLILCASELMHESGPWTDSLRSHIRIVTKVVTRIQSMQSKVAKHLHSDEHIATTSRIGDVLHKVETTVLCPLREALDRGDDAFSQQTVTVVLNNVDRSLLAELADIYEALHTDDQLIATIKSALSLQLPDLSEVLRVPTSDVHSWIRGTSLAGDDERRHLELLAYFSTEWNRMSVTPVGDKLHKRPVGYQNTLFEQLNEREPKDVIVSHLEAISV
jgi:hypothetical protein